MTRFFPLLLLTVLLLCCVPQSCGQSKPQQLLYLFPLSDIALSVALAANQSAVYISTFEGKVYAIPLPVASNTPLPAPIYASSAGSSAPVFQAISISPLQDRLLLLDIRSSTLQQLTVSTSSISTICTFTSEQVASLTSLAVDWTKKRPVAYIASQTNSVIYAVDTTTLGQTQNSLSGIYTEYSGLVFTGLTVVASSGVSILYITSPVITQGFSNVVLSYLQVQGTSPLSASSTTALYSSNSWWWPDAVVVNPAQTMAWVLDGGYDKGYVPSEAPYQTGKIYQLNLTQALTAPGAVGSATATTLYSSTTVYLRGGLQLTADNSTLVYVATNTLNELVVNPALVQKSLAVPLLTSSASLCVLLYSYPGSVDYPFSLAYSLSVIYNLSSIGAVTLVSGSGTRTYTNRFGTSSITSVNLSTSVATPLVFLYSSSPFNATDLTFSLASPVQLPGGDPLQLISTTRLYSVSGAVLEAGSAVLDQLGQAHLSSIPGFHNATIDADNVNSLSADYNNCKAPITFTNGLRAPTQPGAFSSAYHISYSYSISDGLTYRVQTNLTLTTASLFASTSDLLGNPYQVISSATGNRTYTYLPTGFTLTSSVTLANVSGTAFPHASQRFYPYAFLQSSPGVYTLNTAPFLDADGLAFNVIPAVPAIGQMAGAYSTVSVFLNLNQTSQTVVLSESPISIKASSPQPSLQQQSYSIYSL